MKQYFCCMNLKTNELEFYSAEINKECIINLLNQKLSHNSKLIEKNVYLEIKYKDTIIQNEEMFRSVILSIFSHKIIDLSEIHYFCHSNSELKNSHNIEIIYNILNEINFELELSLTDQEMGIYIRKLMEKKFTQESIHYAEQIKTAILNTTAMSDVNFSISCKQKKY